MRYKYQTIGTRTLAGLEAAEKLHESDEWQMISNGLDSVTFEAEDKAVETFTLKQVTTALSKKGYEPGHTFGSTTVFKKGTPTGGSEIATVTEDHDGDCEIDGQSPVEWWDTNICENYFFTT